MKKNTIIKVMNTGGSVTQMSYGAFVRFYEPKGWTMVTDRPGDTWEPEESFSPEIADSVVGVEDNAPPVDDRVHVVNYLADTISYFPQEG